MTRALLHGFLGDPCVWDGITTGRAIALPGHHDAPIAPTWAENLEAIAREVRGCEVAIGYSLGARVALGLLAIDAVPRVVLISVNPGLPGIPGIPGADDSARDTRRQHDRIWATRFRSEPLPVVLDAWEAQPLFATQARVAPDILAARRARRQKLDPAALAHSLEAMGLAEMPDYRAAITRDRCTLVVGADDAKYVALARTLDAPVHVIDHAGHDPLLEQPVALAKVLASLS